MFRLLTGKLLVVFLFCWVNTASLDAASLVRLSIDSDQSTGGQVLLSESGWPLSIRMVVEFPPGKAFPSYAINPNFPIRENWGMLIFADPDGCLNPPVPGWQANATPECGVPEILPLDWDWSAWVPPASDEIYMEFWPGVDMAGVVDHAGNAERRLELVDSAGSRGPEFKRWDSTGSCTPGTGDSDCVRMGPPTGGEVADGYGFGADDDIPGLVVIAEYGIGRVFNEPEFNLSTPLAAVNLAGLVNSVSYNLSDLRKRRNRDNPIVEQTRVWAQINMPINVVRHLIQYDACTGNVTWQSPEQIYAAECDGNNLWRIDGGPAEAPFMKFDRGDAASIALLEATTFTLKVFLVAGQAPSRLFDEDGDGDVDSADAVAAGYTLLSNQDSIDLLQISRDMCFGGGSGVIIDDLDNNGAVDVPIVCPTSPGELGRPPR